MCLKGVASGVCLKGARGWGCLGTTAVLGFFDSSHTPEVPFYYRQPPPGRSLFPGSPAVTGVNTSRLGTCCNSTYMC